MANNHSLAIKKRKYSAGLLVMLFFIFIGLVNFLAYQFSPRYSHWFSETIDGILISILHWL